MSMQPVKRVLNDVRIGYILGYGDPVKIFWRNQQKKITFLKG